MRAHLVQQRRGAGLIVAVVVVEGHAALVGEEDEDAGPVHLRALGARGEAGERLKQ